MIVFLLVSYGTTLIVTQSKLFASFREAVERKSAFFGTLFHCPMCFGWWAGAWWAVFGLWPRTALPRPLELLAAGCASSAFSWAMRVVLHRLGENEL